MFTWSESWRFIVKHRTNHEVQTITLDKFVSLEGLGKFDIKMDIEGAELFALRGSVLQ